MEFIPLLVFGILLTLVGIPNLLGSIASIHWYNRRRVSEADAPKYGRLMGIGTVVIGASVALNAVLLMIWSNELLYLITLGGSVIGLGVILFAQFKYNKGLF